MTLWFKRICFLLFLNVGKVCGHLRITPLCACWASYSKTMDIYMELWSSSHKSISEVGHGLDKKTWYAVCIPFNSKCVQVRALCRLPQFFHITYAFMELLPDITNLFLISIKRQLKATAYISYNVLFNFVASVGCHGQLSLCFWSWGV